MSSSSLSIFHGVDGSTCVGFGLNPTWAGFLCPDELGFPEKLNSGRSSSSWAAVATPGPKPGGMSSSSSSSSLFGCATAGCTRLTDFGVKFKFVFAFTFPCLLCFL
ncbi:hypothetical protein HanIR_Chr13g0648441 [Helianthus annuus]|nr:hypothetical protein HanIR_Chr13g0648441 [Helianthus annuus]